MNVFKNFYESVKRGYNQEPNLGPKESLIILIIICIVGVLYLIQKYHYCPVKVDK